MVLFDPFERPLLQLVMSHPATNKRLFPRRAPPWAMSLSRLSDAQLRSAHAFTQFAINNLRGETGTQQFGGNTVSRAAVIVATEYPNKGIGVFGGLSAQERLDQQYAAAEATEERLRTLIDQRGIQSGAARGGVATDGGQVIDEPPSGFVGE